MIWRHLVLCGALLALPLAAMAATPAKAPIKTTPAMAAPAPAPAHGGMRATAGFSLGVNGGLGAEGDLTLDRIAQGLPVSARFAVAYRVMDPGDPLAARHVFINANSNGEPEESGSRWDFRLDALYQTEWLSGLRLYGGPRYSMFTGNFKFVGGNEFFDVTSHQWGLGAGVDSRFAMNTRTDLVIGAGLDFYADGWFESHDTRYNPDGTSVSPVDEYGYTDADEAINQPTWEPRFTVGIGYRLGR